jgi:hypothetical protein
MVSKSMWNLPGGPWDRLFAGTWSNFNVAVYENPEKVLLTTIFPKKGEINWIMVRVDKILLVPEGIDKMMPKLEGKNLHVIRQQLPGRNMTYLLLLSPPTTVEFGSKQINSEVMEKVVRIGEEIGEIKNIADSVGVEIIDMKDASHKESAGILGNPSLLMTLLNISPEKKEIRKEAMHEIVLGKEGEDVFKVDEDMFGAVLSVRKGSPEERDYVGQMLIESAMIDPAPIPIIFDFADYPLKLDEPNPYPYNYKEYGIKYRNRGFEYELIDPLKETKARIDLNSVDSEFFWHLFGLGKDESVSLILAACSELQNKKRFDTLSDVYPILEKNERDSPAYARALRVMKLAEKEYKSLFSKEGALESIIKPHIKEGSMLYLRLNELSQTSRLMFIIHFLKMVQEMKTSSDLSVIERRRLLHLLPVFRRADFITGRGELQSEVVKKLIGSELGSLFIKEDKLPMELESRVHYKFTVTGMGKAKLQIGGKNKDIDIRPLLSCPP